MGRLHGNNLTNVKKHNEILIKEVVYKYAPISRSEIADMLSLTPPTITTNITELIETGLIKERTNDESDEVHGIGRRPVKLDIVPNAFYVIGVEIGPYKTVVVLLNLRGVRIAEYCYQSERKSYSDEVECLSEIIKTVIQKGRVERAKILGIGIGIPGFVETKRGIVRQSTLRCWNGKPIAKDISEQTGLPVLIENNTRVRTVGEELFGREVRPDTFAYYLISYGIACPLYVGNQIMEGNRRGAGEAGHMVAVLDGPKCETCGNYGCLEEIASERAIIKYVKDYIKSGSSTLITELCKDIEQITMQEILQAQMEGDELADQVIKRAITYLGVMLANIINLVYPPLVLVDAFIMQNKKNQEYLLSQTRKHIFGLYEEEIKIEFVPYSPFTGARGAAALAIKHFLISGKGKLSNDSL